MLRITATSRLLTKELLKSVECSGVSPRWMSAAALPQPNESPDIKVRLIMLLCDHRNYFSTPGSSLTMSGTTVCLARLSPPSTPPLVRSSLRCRRETRLMLTKLSRLLLMPSGKQNDKKSLSMKLSVL